MLEKAFDAGLIFTIGRSMKTGQDRIAIFNGITHKTKIGGGGMYGYPDANYLDLVESELTQRGVKWFIINITIMMDEGGFLS